MRSEGGTWGGIKFPVEGRLLPVIVQDNNTNEVLMLAYMDEEALEKTLSTGKAHFWSRERKRLWLKGESSGNFQYLVDALIDCDGDALLLRVRQVGGACHTGHRSCFFRRLSASGEISPVEEAGGGPAATHSQRPDSCGVLYEICEVIDERKANPSPESYTARLFSQGQDGILKKVSEEAGEVLIASKNGDRKEIVYEAADLLFHLLVALRYHGIHIDEVFSELEARRRK